jgi:stage II sporulation protein E
MGSGRAAGRESDLAIRLLEKFLRAGVQPEAALRTLNSALLLRGEEQGGFTTVDLCRLDLFTGEGTVYKYGAAPTYLRKGGTVVKISGTSLPAGLAEGERVDADATPFHLEPGDWAMLVTDGVTDGEADGWIRELFSRQELGSPKDLARQVLEQSGIHAAVSDDRTVLVFRVERR